MIQVTTYPVVWLNHSTSAELEEPLNFPIPANCHWLRSTGPKTAQPATAPLLISQAPTSPVLWFIHRISSVPLPSKSLMPNNFHWLGSAEPRPIPPVTAPFDIFHASTAPVVSLNHSISVVPGPIKAPV